MKKFIIKNHNKIHNFKSGLMKDKPSDKLRYDLIPHELLTRLAELYTKSIEKYPENNWKKATKEESIEYKKAAWRHFMQWINETELTEDHAMQLVWNIFAFEWINKNKND